MTLLHLTLLIWFNAALNVALLIYNITTTTRLIRQQRDFLKGSLGSMQAGPRSRRDVP